MATQNVGTAHAIGKAYVAIRRFKAGGAYFAYLPSPDAKLPSGYEWNLVRDETGKLVRDVLDMTDVAQANNLMTIEAACDLMNYVVLREFNRGSAKT